MIYEHSHEYYFPCRTLALFRFASRRIFPLAPAKTEADLCLLLQSGKRGTYEFLLAVMHTTVGQLLDENFRQFLRVLSVLGKSFGGEKAARIPWLLREYRENEPKRKKQGRYRWRGSSCASIQEFRARHRRANYLGSLFNSAAATFEYQVALTRIIGSPSIKNPTAAGFPEPSPARISALASPSLAASGKLLSYSLS